MTKLLALLSGKKTYLLALAWIVYKVTDHVITGTPLDVNALAQGAITMALRAGVTKAQNGTVNVGVFSDAVKSVLSKPQA